MDYVSVAEPRGIAMRKRALTSCLFSASLLLAISSLLAGCGGGVDGPDPTHKKEKVAKARMAAHRGGTGQQKRCNGTEEEFGICPIHKSCEDLCKPVNCEFGPWAEWSYHGGCTQLKNRTRKVEVPNNECGSPCHGISMQTARDPRDYCLSKSVDCKISPWGDWSECKTKFGQSVRSREIKEQPALGGQSCTDILQQTKSCSMDAKRSVDCDFHPWQDWTACSTTCGWGKHTRERHISNRAWSGGRTCSGSLTSVEPCQNRKCPSKDCFLREWSEWSNCTVDTKQRIRQRDVLSATGAGKACQGATRESEACQSIGRAPCVVSDWTRWSKCDKKCGGGQIFRRRNILAPMTQGGDCVENLEETDECNTQRCKGLPRDCVLSAWEDWSECDGKCSGTKVRQRHIVQPSEVGGHGCEGSLSEISACKQNGVKECREVDCQWGVWEDWSGCSCPCGGGTKRRERAVRQAPRNGGMACEALHKSEAMACNTQSCVATCRDGKWATWSDWSKCSASCDTGYRMRKRHLAQEPNSCGKAAHGARTEFQLCAGLKPCIKSQDCKVSDWNAWSGCSCLCFGVRERVRIIEEYVTGNGKPCVADLREVSSCNPVPNGSISDKCGKAKKDCVLSEWTGWSKCSRTCDSGQRERTRLIYSPAQGGGLPCLGALNETSACVLTPCNPVKCRDCTWQAWGPWSECSVDSGLKYRHRNIGSLPNDCGKACDSTITKEIVTCPTPPPTTLVCRWTAWSSNSSCSTKECGSLAKSQNRILGFTHTLLRDVDKTHDALFHTGGGAEMSTALCSGTQVSIADCGLESCCRPRHCEWSDWSEWSDPRCEGLCDRTRIVERTNNECGNPCSGPEIETKVCPVNCEVPQDCELSDWNEWTSCKSLGGQRSTYRTVKRRSVHDGKGCEGATVLTVPCFQPANLDCLYSEWGEWDECPVECGGGTVTRKRNIKERAGAGGKLCSGALTEVRACNTKSCEVDSRDCKLSDWDSWSGCGSASGHQKYRSRKISQTALGPGVPCSGNLEETEECKDQIDCALSDWTAWGECDRFCGGGQRTRNRDFHTFPKNGGKACPSDMTETQGCNVGKCWVPDCELSQWKDWGVCSTSCDAGQRSRHRDLKSLRENGGKACTAPLVETVRCELEPCTKKQDCEWGEWKAWSDCTCTCGGGSHTRSRWIKNFPAGGGAPCVPQATQELASCNTAPCKAGACVDGSWHAWSSWSNCSAKCGGGVQTRTRSRAVMANDCGKPAGGFSVESQYCNMDSCEKSTNCEFSEWLEWSSCSRSCYGLRERDRMIRVYGRGSGTFCHGALKETKVCNTAEDSKQCPPKDFVDCKLNDWDAWSACSSSCGGGTQYRARSINTTQLRGGARCSEPLIITGECARNACEVVGAVDCKLGDWKDWGICDKCGGERTRFRHVEDFPSNGGVPCPDGNLTEVGACHSPCDNLDQSVGVCKWASWSQWSKCSASCGYAKRKRSRKLAVFEHQESVEAAPRRHLESMPLDSPDHVLELVGAFTCALCTASAVVAFYFTACKQGSGSWLR